MKGLIGMAKSFERVDHTIPKEEAVFAFGTCSRRKAVKAMGRMLVKQAAAFLGVGAACLGMSSPALGQAEVIKGSPGDGTCFFEPGDVPGFDEFIDASCVLVFTPSGNVEIIAHGQLPADFELDRAVRGELPCFDFGSGQVVATPSGRVNATCHFNP